MKNKRRRWHRLLGLILEPLFDKLGYETKIEYDLSKKQQFIDIIAVKKKQNQPIQHNLPDEYWKNFGELNLHNLISFKSYSESFGGFSLMELFGHYISYIKENDIDGNEVNLYVITNHFPQKLLKPFYRAGFIEENTEEESVDLAIPGLKPVRFLLTRETSNPVLLLFSGEKEQVGSAFAELKDRTDLLNQISRYFNEILAYYNEEVLTMYTKEDFLRDHPPESQSHFLFPWEEEYHQQEVKKGKVEGKIEGLKEGKIKGALETIQGLYQDGVISKEEYQKRVEELKEQLNSLIIK